jgi:hypothetical protein
LDRARWQCQNPEGGSDGYFAKLYANDDGQNSDLLMQGVNTYGMCTDNAQATVCLDYIHDVTQSGRPDGALMSFDYPDGCWAYGAGGADGGFGCTEGTFDGDFLGWKFYDGEILDTIDPPTPTSAWQTVCFSEHLYSSPDRLAFGWVGGQPFISPPAPNGGDVNNIGLDNVGLALAGSGYVHVDVDPDTLNPKSKGKWITVYIKPAKSYCGYPDPESFKIVSLQYVYDYYPQGEILETAIDADKCEYDYDEKEWVCKFPRSAVIDETEAVCEGDQKDYLQIGVAYQANGAVFVGQDHIRYLKDQLDTYCHSYK